MWGVLRFAAYGLAFCVQGSGSKVLRLGLMVLCSRSRVADVEFSIYESDYLRDQGFGCEFRDQE